MFLWHRCFIKCLFFLMSLLLISYIMLQNGGERSCLTDELCSKLRKAGVGVGNRDCGLTARSLLHRRPPNDISSSHRDGSTILQDILASLLYRPSGDTLPIFIYVKHQVWHQYSTKGSRSATGSIKNTPAIRSSNFSAANHISSEINITVTFPLSSMSLPRAAIVSTSSETSTSSVTIPMKIQSSSVPNSGPAERRRDGKNNVETWQNNAVK